MNITALPMSGLSASQIAAWQEIQRANPALDNPLFTVELVQHVAAVREVEVAVMTRHGGPVGFVPFYRDHLNRAKAIAEGLSGFEGAIVEPTTSFDVRQLVRGAGLRSWHFRNQLHSQADWQPFQAVTAEAPYMDLSDGFEAYRVARREAGSDELQEALRKSRKLEREHDDVRFEPFSQSQSALDTLLAWKGEQLRQMNARNLFSLDWSRGLLAAVVQTRTDEFSGMLSVLHVGDRLAAASLSICSRQVLHGWLTAFDPAFRKYSPGLVLLARIAQTCESLGIRRIDMGRGPEPYKRSFQSGTTGVVKGIVELQPLVAMARQRWLRWRESLRKSPLGEPIRHLVHALHRKHS